MVWISQVQNSKDVYIGLFNISDEAKQVKLDFVDAGLKGKITVRDLCKKADIGVFKKSYAQKINAHGSVLLRLKVN